MRCFLLLWFRLVSTGFSVIWLSFEPYKHRFKWIIYLKMLLNQNRTSETLLKCVLLLHPHPRPADSGHFLLDWLFARERKEGARRGKTASWLEGTEHRDRKQRKKPTCLSHIPVSSLSRSVVVQPSRSVVGSCLRFCSFISQCFHSLTS